MPTSTDPRPCNVCGRELTDDEKARMDLDIDFIEHHGHLIGREPTSTALDFNAYQLARMAECSSPDSLDSAGAKFLVSVLDMVNEALSDGETLESAEDSGRLHEIADGAPDVYTYTRWQEFVDLEAYNEDPVDLGVDPSDLTAAAGVCLYMIAERLARALFEAATDDEAE